MILLLILGVAGFVLAIPAFAFLALAVQVVIDQDPEGQEEADWRVLIGGAFVGAIFAAAGILWLVSLMRYTI